MLKKAIGKNRQPYKDPLLSQKFLARFCCLPLVCIVSTVMLLLNLMLVLPQSEWHQILILLWKQKDRNGIDDRISTHMLRRQEGS